MNFWQFLTNTFAWLNHRGTRILGIAVGTLTTLTATDIVPASHLKYYLAAIAVLTYWRGQGNADTIATKIIEKQANSLPLAQPPSEPKP